MSKILKIGIVQEHNTAGVEQNMMRMQAGIERCAAQGAALVVLQELHNSLYFARPKILPVSTSPSLYLGHLPNSMPI